MADTENNLPSGITNQLQAIMNAIYGKDVRNAIVDGLKQCYYDANDVVKVSDDEPVGENIKIWIKPETETEYKVPTWEEFQQVVSSNRYIIDNLIGQDDSPKTYRTVTLPSKNYGALVGEKGDKLTTAVTNNYYYYIFDSSSIKQWKARIRQFNNYTYAHYIYGVDASGNIVFTTADSNGVSGNYDYEFTLPASAEKLYIMNRVIDNFEAAISCITSQPIAERLQEVTQRLTTVETTLDSTKDKTEETRNYLIATKLPAILNMQSTGRYLKIAYITDTHVVEAENYHCLENLKLFDEISNFADCAVHGGDVTQGTDLKKSVTYGNVNTAYRYLSKVKVPMFVVHGNHDVNARYVSGGTWSEGASGEPDQMISDTTFNSLFQSPALIKRPYSGSSNNYFYTDYDDFKIRIVVLNDWCGSNKDSLQVIGTEQGRWLVEEALNFLSKDNPSEWTVLLFKHSTTVSTNLPVSITLQNILSSFTQGINVASSSGYTSPFYVQGAIPLILIHGHSHTDYFINSGGYCNIGVDRSFVMEKDGVIGTPNEFCCSIFTVDTDAKTLYETRFGRGSDRVFKFGIYGQDNNYML